MRLWMLAGILGVSACSNEQDHGRTPDCDGECCDESCGEGGPGPDVFKPPSGDGGGSIDPVSPPPPTQQTFEFGTFQGISPATMGLHVVGGYVSSVTLAEASGGLGCALVADESGSPGIGSTALVVAKIEAESGDHRCPAGVYAVRSDRAWCDRSAGGVPPPPGASWGGVPSGCALYKHWGPNGQQDAAVLATGGYISIQETRTGLRDELVECEIEASFNFGVEHQVSQTFSYVFSPFGTADTFCVP